MAKPRTTSTSRRPALLSILLLAVLSGAHAAPARLLTEWLPGTPEVSDPCPDLSWEAAGQVACRVQVGRGETLLWESGRLETPVPVVEYDGPALPDGAACWWRVRVWDAGGEGEWSARAGFTYRRKARPSVRPHLRAFMNFGGSTPFAVENLDLVYRSEAKRARPSILALNYSLLATMVVPSPKAEALAKYCTAKGLSQGEIPEAMFAHFAADTEVTLHVGAERAGNPRETRRCPGWDPRNDRNSDGRVDDEEAGRLANPKATARVMKQSRIPIYYWGPPADDYVMNVAHPAYQEFLAEEYCPAQLRGFDGLYVDTMPSDVPAAGATAPVLEFPRPPAHPHQWLEAMQALLARVKRRLPDAPITANCWHARPLVIDGFQDENWLRVDVPAPEYERLIEAAAETDRRGKIQMLQYNPIYDEKLCEFGRKVPISRDRDALFGLATYALVHGDHTYFGFGSHPYNGVEQLWPRAASVDIGMPKAPYRVFAESAPAMETEAGNLLPDGDFEREAAGKPAGWILAEPVALDTAQRHSGRHSVRIASDIRQVNNINKCPVTLKPNTSYTLSCWMRTDNVVGEPGAQVYPYEFEGMMGGGMISVTGTTGWKRYALCFTTGADAAGRINVRMYGATGTAWFDDVRLTEGGEMPWKVLARDFTKALVLVKPYAGGPWSDATATEHVLTGAFRPLRADGSLGEPVRNLRLRGGEAAILLRGE